jgi:transposase
MDTSIQGDSKLEGRRTKQRRWSVEEREAIVRASLKKGTTVSAVAQLYGVHVSQIYDWRKQARQLGAQQSKAASFVPVQVKEEERTALQAKPDCSVVIEAERARITINGRIDAGVVRTIFEYLAQ